MVVDVVRTCCVGVSVLLLGVVTAEARRVTVNAGPGTPLQDAIDAASPGDSLVLSGVFAEGIVVDRRLTLIGGRSGRGWTDSIEAPCGVPSAILVTADGVRLRGIGVSGGSEAVVRVSGADRVQVEVYARSRVGCGTAYGVDVVSSTRAVVRRSLVNGPFAVANVRVADSALDARNLVHRVGIADAPGDAIRVEGAAPGGVRLEGNAVAHPTFLGIRLREADGCVVRRNAVVPSNGMTPSSGGILVEAGSDGNRIVANTFRSTAQDVLDLGTGNCWDRNVYFSGTVAGCP